MWPLPGKCPAANDSGARVSSIENEEARAASSAGSSGSIRLLGDDREVAAVALRNGAAVRAGPRMTEEGADAVGDLGIDDVLHATGGELDFGLRQAHGRREQHFGKAPPPHQVARLTAAARRELQRGARRKDEPALRHALQRAPV